MELIKKIFTAIGIFLMLIGIGCLTQISPEESLSAKISLSFIFIVIFLAGLLILLIARGIIKLNISSVFNRKDTQSVKSSSVQKADPQSQKAAPQTSKKPMVNFITCQKEAFRILLKRIPSVEITPDLSASKQNINIKDYYLDTASLRANTSLSRLSDFVVIDTETTGLQPGKNKIIQVTAIRFTNFQASEIFNTYINPQTSIPPEITNINGITDEMVSRAPTFESILPSLVDFIGSSTLVGHNIAFDIKFLRKFGYDNESSKRLYYDTLALSRQIDKEVENHKLITACEENNIYFPSAHSSEYDAFATGLLFVSYIDQKIGLPNESSSLHDYYNLSKKILKVLREKSVDAKN